MSGADLLLSISRAVDASYDAAENEVHEASAWMERVQTGTLDNDRCAVCERKDGPFEKHHVTGRRHGDLTVLVCVRCHRRLTERQNRWDPRWQTEARSERLDESLLVLGLADLLDERALYFGPEYLRLASKMYARYAQIARETI